MATVCESSHPTDVQAWNRLPRSIPSDKRNRRMRERQRRKDMNALFAMLRSLLPNENLPQKVEDLSTEREKMKANSDKNAEVSFEGLRLSCNDKVCIRAPPTEESNWELPIVKIKSKGSVVQVWTNTFQHQIVYSDLLIALEEGGLEVFCAASSAIKNKVYHTIHTKVSDLGTFKIDTLKQKLWHLTRINQTKDQDLQTVEAARA